MKKIISLLLTMAIIFSLIPQYAHADALVWEKNSNICFVVDKDGKREEIVLPVILHNDELYMQPENIAKITRYEYFDREVGFVFLLGKKNILISENGSKLSVNEVEQPFSGVVTIDSTDYLPLSELLPWMNVHCYEEGGSLYVESDILSLWEVIADFNTFEYQFDFAGTYTEKKGGIKALLSVFAVDTCFNYLDAWWKRADINNDGSTIYEYEVFEECFREFATPDIGNQAELIQSLSSLQSKVSAYSTFTDTLYGQLVNDGVLTDLAEGLAIEDLAELETTSEVFSRLNDGLKYMKTSALLLQAAMQPSDDYANALRYIYLRKDASSSNAAVKAVKNILPLLESYEDAHWDIIRNVFGKFASDGVNKLLEKGIENTIEKAFGDILLKSLNSYMDLVKAALSQTWPIHTAFEDTSKMIIFQSVQTDAINAYTSIEKYRTEITVQDLANLRMSAIIFLRTAKKCHETQQQLGNLLGEDNIYQNKLTRIDQAILAFSLTKSAEERDAIVDKGDETQKIKQLWKALRLTDSSQNSTENAEAGNIWSFCFDLNTDNGFEDYISFKPDESGWYTFTADGTGYFWMEAPNREMTEYRLDGHVFSEYGLHYYLSENQQYYIKICSNSEANGELYVAESQFLSLTEGETLQLPLADCYGGFDGGGIATNYFSFTPSSSGIYYFSCGPKDIFTRSATWGIARDAFGKSIQIKSTTENNAGITTVEYQLISGNTYYFGLSASPGGICNITVSSSPNESSNKTDNMLLSNLPDEFMYTSGAGAWMTVVNLEKDGSFTGGYYDTNAGETGSEYPNGTTYICNFSGELSDFEKVDEYTYTTSLLKITTEQNSGEVYYENGVRYIATDPYGFTNADVLNLYLPGTPCADMPQDCLDWLWYHNLSDTLPSNMYVLYNINGGEVFFGNIDIPTNVDGRNYKVLESDISGMITDITGKLNIRSGPGTSYEVVGYLLPNDTVDVYETAYNEEVTWGHIEQGWISMDYVENIIHRNSANTIYAENYVDYTTAEILAELGPEYDIPGAYAGSYLLKTINYPNLYFAYNLDDPTSEPYITGFESVVCIYLFGDAAINEYLSANMSKVEIDEAVNNPDVLSSSTDTFYMALDNTGNVFQYVIETHKAYISYEWYLDSGSSTNAPADSVCVSPK